LRRLALGDFLVLVEREIHLHQDSQYLALEEWNSACTRCHTELFARVHADLPRIVAWINSRFHARIYEDPYSPFCLVAENNQDADSIQVFLEEYCAEVSELTVVRNDVYARFSHSRYNKGTALGEIARQLGIKREEVFAAGDHLNDVPMLCGEFARCVMAPDNAIPAVKELIRSQNGYISHQPWGHGVARGLEHYLSSRPASKSR